jgi:hypothetical protein
MEAEGVFLLIAFLIILLRQILKGQFFNIRPFIIEGINLSAIIGFPRKFLERLFEFEGIKLGVLFGFPTSILSFFLLSFILASGETSLSFIERVSNLIDSGDIFTTLIRCSIVGSAAFTASCMGGLLIASFGGTNNGESERNQKFAVGIIIFGLLVGGPCSLLALAFMSNS